MKRTYSLALMLVAFLAPGLLLNAQPCADSLNIYTFYYQGKKYEIVKELNDWDDAADCAEERGGYLVHIGSQQEQDSVYYHISVGAAISNTYTSVPDGGGVAYIWIGATDLAQEGNWLWDGDNDGSGTLFWTGQGAAGAGGGAAVGGAFVNWGGKSTGTIKEPDNYAGNQDGAAIALRGWPGGSGALGIAGEWNDIAVTNSIYFIIEYETGIGINETAPSPGEENFSLFPNPSSGDYITLLTEQDGSMINKAEIFSVNGRLITTIETGQSRLNMIPVSDLPAGVYILKVYTSGGITFNKRFLRTY